MYIIVDSIDTALNIKAHEERDMQFNVSLFYNSSINKWAIGVSGEINYGYDITDKLEEGWVCRQ